MLDQVVHGNVKESRRLEDRGCWRVSPSEADCLLDNGSASGVTSLKVYEVGRITDVCTSASAKSP